MPLERAVENSAASSSAPINKPPQGGFFIGKKRKDRRELERAEDKNISGGNIFTAKQRNILTSKGSGSDRGEIRCRWNELLKTAQPHRPPQ